MRADRFSREPNCATYSKHKARSSESRKRRDQEDRLVVILEVMEDGESHCWSKGSQSQ